MKKLLLILTLLIIAHTAVAAPQLSYHNDGTFKIVQFTDIHLEPQKGEEYFQKYFASLGAVLDAEQPDMVVVTGDILWGEGWTKATLQKYCDITMYPMTSRHIPWAFVLGNHDVESDFSGKDMIAYMQTMPYSLVQAGPTELGSDGNYWLPITAANKSAPAQALYFLNSHSHHTRYIDYTAAIDKQLTGTRIQPNYEYLFSNYGAQTTEIATAIKNLDSKQQVTALGSGYTIKLHNGRSIQITRAHFSLLESDYDWLYPEQVDWYRQQSTMLAKQNNGSPLAALMFMHIPLQEYHQVWDNGLVVGTKLEHEETQTQNTGMFAALQEKHDVMGVFCGHDHVIDYIGSLHNIALAYGRKSGLGGYGPSPMERGGRVIVLHNNERTFDTWIRTDSGAIDNKISVPEYFD